MLTDAVTPTPELDPTVVSSPIPTPTTESPAATDSYELNELHEVEFNVRPGADRPLMVTHRLRRATLEELAAREQATPYRSHAVSNDEEEIDTGGGAKANTTLYDKTILDVKGAYNREKFMDFSNLKGDERAQALSHIPSTHKNQVVGAVYSFDSEAEFSEDDMDNFIWGEGQEYVIKTEIGQGDIPDFVVRHTMREPTEREMLNYRPSRFLVEKGQKKPTTKVMSNLFTIVDFYDKLIVKVEGATYNGSPVDVGVASQLQAIDALMKKSVVEALLRVTQLDLGN